MAENTIIGSEIIDAGKLYSNDFNRMLNYISRNIFKSVILKPYFADARGNDLDVSTELDNLIYGGLESPCAILPWKLFDIHYIPQTRVDNYLDGIYPLIDNIFDRVKKILRDNHNYIIE